MTEPSRESSPPRDALGARLVDLRNALDDDLGAIAGLRGVRHRRATIDALRVDLDRQLERSRRAAVITLVGSTGAGKSTLLNALVGADVATAGVNRPTTTRPVVYAPEDAALDELLDGLPGEAPVVERYRPDSAASGPWSEQVLIDAPDVNGPVREHRDVVAALADRSDVLLCVFHDQSVVEEAAVSFLSEYARRRHLMLVLNRADELTDAARDELLGQLRENAASLWGLETATVLATSARAACTSSGAPGFDALCGALTELVRTGSLGAVRRRNALGTARELGELFGAVRADDGQALESLPGEVRTGVESVAQAAGEEVAERLRLRRRDFAALLVSEVARLWDGPVGWALRTGGLASMGLSAGALLARRNPLLAAGAAVGGVAAGRVRDAAQRRSLSQSDEFLPPRARLEELHDAGLASARGKARVLFGRDAELPVPDADRVHARIGEAVADAWGEAFGRDLPRLSESSVRASVRLVLDVPVYALLGWVVYQAVRGFFVDGTPFVGIDYLLNLGIVLLAYLFCVRVVVKRYLGYRAERLLGRVIEAVGASLAGLGPAAEREARETTRDADEALARLAELGGELP